MTLKATKIQTSILAARKKKKKKEKPCVHCNLKEATENNSDGCSAAF